MFSAKFYCLLDTSTYSNNIIADLLQIRVCHNLPVAVLQSFFRFALIITPWWTPNRLDTRVECYAPATELIINSRINTHICNNARNILALLACASFSSDRLVWNFCPSILNISLVLCKLLVASLIGHGEHFHLALKPGSLLQISVRVPSGYNFFYCLI
jgi:hypothetical protein